MHAAAGMNNDLKLWHKTDDEERSNEDLEDLDSSDIKMVPSVD